MTGLPPDSSSDGIVARIAAPPSRWAGVAWALAAFTMFLTGLVLIPTLLITQNDQVLLLRWLFAGNALALLAFLPLLRAVHAIVDTPAVPAGAMVAAYGVLLIRPLVFAVQVVSAPFAVIDELGGLLPEVASALLLTTTAMAAGLAAWAVLPLAQNAATSGRRVIVGAGVGLLVVLALYSFEPYIVPLSALGVAVALWMRTGRTDRANGPAGQS